MRLQGKQSDSLLSRRPSLGTLLWRSLRLCCPFCGRHRLFRNLFRMHTECVACGQRFEREGGFFLGSIYFNYGLTALVVAVAYPVLWGLGWLAPWQLNAVAIAFTVLFPIWFFRYARALWLGFDQYVDPRDLTDHGSSQADPPPGAPG